MSYETAFLKKAVTPDLSALLVLDRHAEHPRTDQTPITNLVAWSRRFNLSDEPGYKSPQHFRLHLWTEIFPDLLDDIEENVEDFDDLPDHIRDRINATPYPGFLQEVYMHNHGGIKLSTEPFHDRWDSGWLGWIYINPDNMRAHDLDQDKALAMAKTDLQRLEQYTNREVYTIAIQRTAQPDLLLGSLYPAHGVVPDEKTLDDDLTGSGELSKEERDAVPTTGWKKAVRRTTWEQEQEGKS